MSNEYPAADAIRNICLCGHSGSGKTTLCERLLFDTGVITRQGAVEQTNTVSDFTDEEKHHQHSLQPSMMHFTHEGHHVNLIDTPGMSDFISHSIACFPAVETVLLVIDAVKGIESETRRLMRIAGERNLPRVILINKIDAEAELGTLVDQIRSTFGDICLPINMPTPDRTAVVDVFETDSHEETAFSSAEEAHTKIVDQVVEVDEELMEKYLESGGASLDHKAVHDAFEQALREGHLVPILFASAKTGAGIPKLLHVMASLLPSPMEGNPRPFMCGEERLVTDCDPSKPTIAHVFRVATDKHVGKQSVFRVHQGVVTARSELYVNDSRKPLRIGQLTRLQGAEAETAQTIGPGEIGSVAKIDDIHFDAVLHDGNSGGSEPPHLKPLALPRPMYGLALELKRHADETKFSSAIQKLMDEDPCLILERIAATKQTVLRGLGELHLRVVLEKLESQYGVELETSPPKIAYKESIQGNADGHYRHKKQSGGAGQFGEVYLRVAPLPDDHETGFEFENATVGGSIPKQFMPAIEKGIRQVLRDGAVAGYPLSGVRVEVYDGKHHDVDSKEIAFVTAGRKAFEIAIKAARPVLLEPIVDLEVSVPSQYMGDVTGDISTRRGRVNDTQVLGDVTVVKAKAPLSELQTYSTQLKSMTAGAGSYNMEYSHDEPTPPQVQQEVVAAYKKSDDDD
ncbi:MAG: elongation factor G [Planctomycetales bacterium]|nr:elongation factor G [Planctomycetales bacterium]